MTIKKKSIHRRSKNLAISTSFYDKDFSKWALDQAKLLKKGEFAKLDIDHLIEEIEDLSKREKQSV